MKQEIAWDRAFALKCKYLELKEGSEGNRPSADLRDQLL